MKWLSVKKYEAINKFCGVGHRIVAACLFCVNGANVAVADTTVRVVEES